MNFFLFPAIKAFEKLSIINDKRHKFGTKGIKKIVIIY